MKALAVLHQLIAVARELGRAAAAWPSLRSRTIRAFLLDDLAAIARPCAPLVLAVGFTVAGFGLAFLLRLTASLNAAVGGAVARALLIDGGPVFSAVLIVGMALPLQVAALRLASRRGDYRAAAAYGIPLESLLSLPCIGAYAAATALGGIAWLSLGLLVAPAINALGGAARWLDQARMLLLALDPLDPWALLLHSGLLGAVVGACVLVAAQAGRPENTEIDPLPAGPAAGAGGGIAPALVLAVLSIAVAEALWWFTRWLFGG